MDDDLGKIDSFCPSCRIHIEARVLALHHVETHVIREDLFDPIDRQFTEDVYIFACCIRCKGPLLLVGSQHVVEGLAFPEDEARLVYPTDAALPEAVPGAVARAFSEAYRAYEVKLYDACAAMCRKTLEAVCNEFGESAGRLVDRLDLLLQKGVIDSAMFEWARELRLSGNKDAHADPGSVTENEAKDMIEFARAMLLYAFELPKRLQQARERRGS